MSLEVCLGRIYIDINAPSVPKFKIALPDFKNQNKDLAHPDFASDLPGVISNDLDLSGYFNPLNKEAFLEKEGGMSAQEINFKDWSVIGAELLVKGTYVCIGTSLEVEMRLFDVYQGRQILGKRALGKTDDHRYIMHRLSNEILLALTGHEGITLTKVAFAGTTSGQKEIYLCDYDGYNPRALTADKTISLFPRLSPDGKKVLFTSYKEGGPMMYMKDLETGKVRKISGKPGLNISAAWAPNEDRIALTMSRDGNPDIFTMDLNGTLQKHLVNHWAIDVSPTFSPDGSKIAFVSNRSGSPQVYVMDMVSENVERITFEGNYNTSPNWSALNCIAFTSMNDGRFDICTVNPDGSQLRRLTEGQGNNEDPCWSPDGRYLIFSSNKDGGYHLYLMTAQGANQRRITFQKGEQICPSWGR